MKQKKTPEIVAIVPYAGLGNRLRAIASGIYIARLLNANAVIYWNKTNDCFAGFSELFKPIALESVDLIENHSLLYKLPGRRNLFAPKLLQACSFGQCIYNFNKNTDGDIFKRIGNCSKLLLASCHSMCAHYSLNEIFVPTEEINDNIQSIVSQFTDDTIGVHVRRTDNLTSLRMSDNDSFIRMIDREISLNPQARFYLATDDFSVKEIFTQRYGDRIITVDNPTSRDTLEGMKFAVQELFCLSKSRKILGSAYSSYSEIAAELGHIPLDIAQ